MLKMGVALYNSKFIEEVKIMHFQRPIVLYSSNFFFMELLKFSGCTIHGVGLYTSIYRKCLSQINSHCSVSKSADNHTHSKICNKI